MKTIQILVYVYFCLTSLQIYSQDNYETIYEGEGTYYGGIAGSAGGNCGLPVEIGDYFHCAMNNVEYDGSDACGSCVTVTGPNGSINLKVVDRCPECKSGDIDMTIEAFDKIADLTDGRVPISWKYAACDTNDSDIKIIFKDGSSEFWTGIQFRNLRHAVINLEYQNETTGDDWVSINRELYNYFVAPNGISSPMNLKLTSVLGEQIVLENIILDVSEEINSSQQFIDEGVPVVDENEDTATLFTYDLLGGASNNMGTITSQNEFRYIKETLLYNMLGQVIKVEASIENKNIIRLNTENIGVGIYILKMVGNNNKVITKKIIIMKE